MKHTIREELAGVLTLVGVIWCVFLIGLPAPLNFHSLGLTPRTASGLIGIAAMPFLHANLGHLLSNTAPLLVLLTLLAGSRAKSSAIVLSIVLFGGSLLWLFGRSVTHIGASGLVFGLITFLILSGLFEMRTVPLAIAFLVALLYTGTLLWGIVPRVNSLISWDGHLCGAIAGGMVAYATGNQRPRRR